MGKYDQGILIGKTPKCQSNNQSVALAFVGVQFKFMYILMFKLDSFLV